MDGLELPKFEAEAGYGVQEEVCSQLEGRSPTEQVRRGLCP